MTARCRLLASTAALLWLAGCSGDAARSTEAPPELRDVAPELRAAVAAASQPPAEERLAELSALLEAAFVPEASDPRLAAQAKDTLLEGADAFWVLERALEHELPDVRSNAAFHLGQLGNDASLVPLTLRLKYERDPSCLMWVADALARLHSHAGLEALASVLEDGPRAAPAEGRRQAGEIAISILDRAAEAVAERPSYADLQRDLGRLARRWHRAGRSDGEAPPPSALLRGRIAARLLALSEFQLRPVDDARFVLARLGERALPWLRLTVRADNGYLRNHSLEVLRELGRPAAALVDEVLPLLRDPISCQYAIEALAAAGDPRATPPILALLQSPELDVRTAACGAFGRLGDRAAIAPLRAVLRDGGATLDERVHAACSLARLESGGEGEAFLEDRLAAGDYHAPTVRELLDRARSER
jgi:HEAT repeat protein